MQVGERRRIIERLDHRKERLQKIDHLTDGLTEGLNLLDHPAFRTGWLVLKEQFRGFRRSIFRQQIRERQKELADQFAAGLGILSAPLAIDQPRSRRLLNEIRIVIRDPTPSFDMQRPSGRQPTKRVVHPRHRGGEARFSGARQIRPAKAVARLQRSVFVQDHARRHKRPPDHQIREPSAAIGWSSCDHAS